jgi:hypothetical protein
MRAGFVFAAMMFGFGIHGVGADVPPPARR